ncbi:MAG: hypothetical protein OFPII_22500 [Osedax symbiont Rs1]|nr:MAG: hypothetical protein OFPII_22500 [Osedax symbiont Rs1]
MWCSEVTDLVLLQSQILCASEGTVTYSGLSNKIDWSLSTVS